MTKHIKQCYACYSLIFVMRAIILNVHKAHCLVVFHIALMEKNKLQSDQFNSHD